MDKDEWYELNRIYIDNLIESMFKDLRDNMTIPSYMLYGFSYDFDKLREEMINYLYNN